MSYNEFNFKDEMEIHGENTYHIFEADITYFHHDEYWDINELYIFSDTGKKKREIDFYKMSDYWQEKINEYLCENIYKWYLEQCNADYVNYCYTKEGM